VCVSRQATISTAGARSKTAAPAELVNSAGAFLYIPSLWYSACMDNLEARTRRELADIVAVLTELTGLPSRWSGRVELVPDAEFKGKKRFLCDIQLDAALAEKEARWTTLIHEALHSLSAGYFRDDYQNFQGWEEGVVEHLQRFYRPRVLSRLVVKADPFLFQKLDAEHGYNKFIAALEDIRQAQSDAEASSSEAEAFYLDLLATPLRDRKSRVSRYGFSLPPPERQRFFSIISAASATLRTRG